MKPLLIFGAGAECARVMLEVEHSGEYDVVGIVSQGAEKELWGRPVFAADEAAARFDKSEVAAFATGGTGFLNQDRFGLYIAAKRLGFRMVSIVSQSARIASGVRLRENSFVEAAAVIHSQTQLGENVWVMKGAALAPGVRVGRSSWIGEHAIVEARATLGRNCTLTQNVVIKEGLTLPAWSWINEQMVVATSLPVTTFMDPLFRAPVVLRGAVRSAAKS